MRKIFTLTLILSTLFAFRSFSQCTPNTSEAVSILSIGSIPDLCEGEAYNESITLLIPDTYSVPVVGNANIDSIYNFNITTLSTYGLSFDCHNTNCVFEPGYGCIRIFGTPTSDATSISAEINGDLDYTINTVTTISQTLAGQKFDFSYTIVDEATCNPTTSTEGLKTTAALSASPNPATGSKVTFNQEVSNLIVYDLIGNIVLSEQNGQTIDIGDLADGIYIAKCDQGTIKLFVK